MAMLNGFNLVTTNAATSGTLTIMPSSYNYSQAFVADQWGNLSVSPPKAKTALDWLDERVNEMRVKL